MPQASPLQIIDFWFKETPPKLWWEKNADFDRKIKERFSELYHRAAANELWQWRESPSGALAEIIVLDQFPRNIFRDDGRAFATDALALANAQNAVLRGFDQELTTAKRAFLYMPYMHSESKLIHEEAMRLFAQPGLENNYDFEKRHKAIIDRFGRYPHRNKMLGRESTPEEMEFLRLPGSSF